MATLSARTIHSPSDLLAMPDEKNYELTDGELVEKQPMGMEACLVQGELARLLGNHCIEHRAGRMVVESGFTCFPEDPNKMRRPDVAVICPGRLPGDVIPKGYASVAPDLAVEVVSPGDLLYEVERKVREYLQAGVRRVWVVNPDTRTVRIHRPDGTIQELREDGELTGEEVLPKLRFPVRGIFPPN